MPALPPSLREILTRLRNPESRCRSAALAFALAALAIFALWEIPRWQVTHTPGTTAQLRFDREDAARKTLAQILGGAIVLGTLYTGFRTYQLSREGQITDRFTKAIEQLGWLNGDKPSIEVRLGAIYALERIAIDSPRDHWTIMEILTAYVRENAPADPTRPYTEGEKPRTDIQAILTVLGRRPTGPKRERKEQRLDLSGCRICGANLHHAKLQAANLDGASLQHTLLENADLKGASLIRANLERTTLDKAMLQGADLLGANLQAAHLTQADLQGAFLLRVNLQGANLYRAALQHARMGGAHLQDAHLASTNLERANLLDANLQGVCLDRAILRSANLITANLSGASLSAADLSAAYLERANLKGAKLRQANLQGAHLYEADLEGASVADANFLNVRALQPDQIKSARNWETALYSPDLRQALGLPHEPPEPAELTPDRD